MKEKDSIKELFNNRFKDFEAKVDTGVWQNIESQIQSGTETGIGTSSAITISKVSAWIAGVAAVVGVVAIGYFVTQSEPEGNENTLTEVISEPQETEVKIEEPIELDNTTEEIVTKEHVSNEVEETNNDNTQNQVATTSINNQAIENVTNSDKDINDDVVSNKTENSEFQSIGEEGIVEEFDQPKPATPNEIVVEDQSKVLANPMGGVAPLSVSFTSLAKISKVKWDFDDGTTSDEVSPNHTYENEGIYFVTMIAETESGEVVMDKAIVEVLKPTTPIKTEDESKIFVPNVFTPNGDGMHDELIVNVENIQDYSISIYSVSGKLVFQSDDANEHWNGTNMHGDMVEMGTYYYLVNATGLDGNMFAHKGYITVR